MRNAARTFRSGVAIALFLLCTTPVADAAERYVVIVSGPAGEERFAVLQQTWRETLSTALVDRLGFRAANIIVLDHEASGRQRATRENVRTSLADLQRRAGADDTVLLVLFGHGTIDGIDAKFNLVGPDLTATEWGSALDGIAARLVVVNTTEASFPFLTELSRRGRVVITATDSPIQRYATVFAEYFVRAIADSRNDYLRNGHVSIWELFERAASGVTGYYGQRGQLATERALLDDNGDGQGSGAMAEGADGALARTIFLDAPSGGDRPPNPAAMALAAERRTVERQIDDLRTRRAAMGESAYSAQLEQLLIRLARITRELDALR